MVQAGNVLANAGTRILTGAILVAAVFAVGGEQRTWAQAPITYAKATPAPSAFETLPTTLQSPSYGVQSISYTGSKPPASSLGDNAPIDLRPGAARVNLPSAPQPAYRPAAPRAAAPVAPAVMSLTSAAPIARSTATTAFAEPYAGPPYQVEGKWYVPTHEPNYDEVGVASWYGPTFHGKASASGEVFDENAMTAAHPTLPIPSLVRVTNLENGRTVIVRINDRGPFVDDRLIDLSKKAGEALDMHAKGTAKVRVQYVGPAPAAPNSLPDQRVYDQVAPKLQPAPMPVSQPLPLAAPIEYRSADQSGYFLQAGSFADLGNAHALRSQLNSYGKTSVAMASVNGGQYYRVMVGPWASRAEAEQAQGRLSADGRKSIVVAKVD